MTKVKWLMVFAAGYVAGAAAGRQRYEQIKAGAQKVVENPRVRSAAKKAQDAVAEQAPVVAETVKNKTTGAAGAVVGKVRPGEQPEMDGSDDVHLAPADGGPALS